jgi:hypothetical protein
MNRFKKEISSDASGTVEAEIIRIKGNKVCARDFWMYSLLETPKRLERRYIKAHTWADKTMLVLEAQEIS